LAGFIDGDVLDVDAVDSHGVGVSLEQICRGARGSSEGLHEDIEIAVGAFGADDEIKVEVGPDLGEVAGAHGVPAGGDFERAVTGRICIGVGVQSGDDAQETGAEERATEHGSSPERGLAADCFIENRQVMEAGGPRMASKRVIPNKMPTILELRLERRAIGAAIL